MTLQNRVLPTGEFVRDPARGLLTGNRGILHRPDRSLGVSRWTHPHWVCCTLRFKERYHGPMPNRGWTALFFLDEAVSLAAGHRPCHECRRVDALRFRAAWQRAHGPISKAAEMDRALHPTRVTRQRQQVRHRAAAQALPDGVFVLTPDAEARPAVIKADQLYPYAPSGYLPPIARPEGPVTVLTPAPTVAVLAAGYDPMLHPTVR
ncbi:MAG: hypothetical protein JXR13_18010 [Thalassovita sp.]